MAIISLSYIIPISQQRPASVVISSQVVNSNSTLISTSDVLETTPVEILFELNEVLTLLKCDSCVTTCTFMPCIECN